MLHVIVPSRGRPHTLPEMCEAFRSTCTANDLREQTTRLTFVVDDDDPTLPQYQHAQRLIQRYPDNFDWARWGKTGGPLTPVMPHIIIHNTAENGRGMSAALNHTARWLVRDYFETVIGFMGDDHRPRTKGWDTAYLEAITKLGGTGIVYGDDGFQGRNLPTQVAISADIVRELGHMAPDALKHLYLDNYWRELGQDADCLFYLPHVMVEHMHPAAGKADMDDNYRRVNTDEIDRHDYAVLAAYREERLPADIARVRALREAKEATRGAQIL